MTVPTEQRISLKVNGTWYEAVVPARRTLADFLREDLGLRGTHLGCEHGICGACTVLVNGRSARSCLMLAVQADGAEVVTVEGLALPDGSLHPLQESFWRHFALQCGFCTPGFLITAYELLRENPNPTEREVREALSGNICRCTGYQAIVEAILALAGQELPGPPALPGEDGPRLSPS